MKKYFSSFSSKSIVLLLFVGLVPAILIGTILYVDKIESETNLLYEQIDSKSESNALSIDRWLSDKKISVESIANDKLLISNIKKLKQIDKTSNEFFDSKFIIEEQTNTALNNFEWIDELILYDNLGNILFYTDIESPMINHYDQSYVFSSLQGNTAISKVIPSLEVINVNEEFYSTGVPTMFISAPIHGEVGLEGILVSRINLSNMNLDIHGDSDSIFNHFIVDSNGLVIDSTSHQLFSNILNTDEQSTNILQKSDSLQNLFALAKSSGHANTESGYINPFGNVVLSSITHVPNTDWFYVLEVGKNDAFADIVSLQIILISTILLTIIAIVWVSLYFANSLSNPIKELQVLAEKITRGERDALSVSSGDKEIVDLSNSLKVMVESLISSENKIKAAEEKYRKLYEDAPEMYRTVNSDGNVIDCNNAYCEKLGYRKEDIIGKSLYEFVPESHIETMRDIFTTWQTHGDVRNKEVLLKRKDGTVFPVLLSSSSVKNDEGKVIAANTLIRDMSDLYNAQKEIEELRVKRLSVIGELTARIAHDLRNPLSVIKNSAEILQITYEDKTDESQKEQWERLDRGIYRMTHQVNDVLDYIRSPPLKIEENSLSVIIQDTIERIQIPDTVNIHPPKNDAIIPCDAEKLEVVFVNLVMNAIQALDRNAGDVTITIDEKHDSGQFVLIQVIDNGPGIPNDMIEKIFDPLFTTRQVGTGLGLPSCKNIVERHNGTINVTSDPEWGTTFSIILPKHHDKFVTSKI